MGSENWLRREREREREREQSFLNNYCHHDHH